MKINYFLLTLFYFIVIFLISLFYFYDLDFKINFDVYLNIIIFITLTYLCILTILHVMIRKNKRLYKKQLVVFEKDDYLIEELSDNQILKELYNKNLGLKHQLQAINEQQDIWLHDIKIPLGTLKLFIENKRKVYSIEDLKVLELVTLDLENQINKKIIFDNIELDINDFHIEYVSLKEILLSLIKRFRPYCLLKNISIDFNVEDIKVLSDYKALYNALEQILNNAIKYSFDNASIKIEYLDNNLIIENEGKNINEQDLNRVFEKGFSGENSMQQVIHSTGLGLYITKKLLTNLNHSISITSQGDKIKVTINFTKVTKM